MFVGLSEEEASLRLAEALVHEYCENFLRNSHRFSVVSELLVSPEWGVVHVPARVMRQLCMIATIFYLNELILSFSHCIPYLLTASG